MASADPDQLRSTLRKAAGGRPVEVRETHISWVFLAGARAYKLKKPIVLDFLNYGTLARRRRMCEEEVRLNRRLAPGVYVGVRAVLEGPHGLALADEDAPGAVDYVVEMRRYDERRTVAALLERGELLLSDMTAIAATIEAFHRDCPVRRGRMRGSARVAREVRENICQLIELAGRDRGRVRSLGRALSAFVAARAHELDDRARRGLRRECHGDLRAEHVLVDRSASAEVAIKVVDCVEFDRGLRTLDVADDLAFLVMDLAALGGERYGRRLASEYRAAGGDCADDATLAFFAAHRALVRAKVLLVRAAQRPARSGASGHEHVLARELLALAERYRWQMILPLVIAVCGLPASGKSYLAAELARRSGLQHLSSDRTRKRLARIRPTDRARPEHYSEAFNRATYAELGRLAAAEAARGGGAIVDATFRHRADRRAFSEAFADAAPLLFVECRAPRHVLLERARARERERGRVSDATAAVVERQLASFEPLSEVPPSDRISLDTRAPVQDLLAAVGEAAGGMLRSRDPGAGDGLAARRRGAGAGSDP